MKLKRLKINKYRNVKQPCELVFNDKMNILLGKNGSGKTTLLNLIVKLLGNGELRSPRDAMDVEFEFCSGDANVNCSVRYAVVPNQIEFNEIERVYQVDSDTRITWGATKNIAKVKQIDRTFTLEVNGIKSDIVITAQAWPFLRVVPLVLNSSEIRYDLSDVAQVTWDLCRMDEALELFHALTNTANQKGLDYRTPEIIANSGIPTYYIIYRLFVPNDVGGENSFSETEFACGSGDTAFVRRVSDILNFKDISVVMPFRNERESSVLSYKGLTFFCESRHGYRIHHDDLSYGQKRMLTFFYYAAVNKHIVVADELVNGLHYEWIKACLDEIKDRQSFLTTQNPILLDHLEFDSPQDVKSTFILCSVDDATGELIWENMSDERAEKLYSAYETEIRHVGEILRGEGLW